MGLLVQGQKFGGAPRTQDLRATDLIRITSTVNQADANTTLSVLSDFLSGNVTGVTLRNIIAIDGVYGMLGEEDLILADATTAAFNIVLPDATTVTKGYQFTVKKIDASVNDITLVPQGGQTIDDAVSALLTGTNKPFISCVSDGTEWWIVN